MHRNITIVVILLVLVVIVGYLVWIRSKVVPVGPKVEEQIQATVAPTPTSTPIPSASASATPSAKQASPAATKK